MSAERPGPASDDAGLPGSHPMERKMAAERAPGGSSVIDVLDRVLDKGIVIDAYVRVSLVGIDLVTVAARIVVSSIETYRKATEPIMAGPAEPGRELGWSAQMELDRVTAENVELRRKLEGVG